MAKQVSGHILNWVKGGGQEGREYAHRQVAEKKLGRKLKAGEIVHHISGNKTDNSPGNLKVMTRAEHNKTDPKMRLGGRKRGS